VASATSLRQHADFASGGARMNGVLAIYRKELIMYFRSPIAYFVISVFLLGTGYFFLYNIFMTGVGTMDETFQNMGVLLLTVIPVVTMRLFSAEYTARTMELLSTLPLKPWQIVLGKYLGAVTVLLLMTLATGVDLIPLYLYGTPETKTILSGYIGFVLLGMACLAIGQFFSALSQNQIIAALITVPVLLGFWFVGHLQTFQNSFVLRDLFGYLSFALHFGDFIRGLMRSEAVVFYLVVVAIALTLNASYLQWRR
jgi:ABC-2 type transport system permease protein